ncbi:MAG: acetamidase/formamidase family protein [Pseudomonadota bacterium]
MPHVLNASPETCHWGFFDAAQAPVLTVASGETVVVHTVSGGPEVMPDGDGLDILPEHLDIQARSARPLPGHILTGPIAVDGAAPGDVIEVRFDAVTLRQNWGWNFIRPLAGTLPEDFPTGRQWTIPLDTDANEAALPWGDRLPLAPFFGVCGTAPPPEWGMVSSLHPRAFGGNLDLKELTAGTSLFLPVFVPGGNVSLGDGHAAQGDGEVNVTAIETALTGDITLTLHKEFSLPGPRAETPTHLIALGLDPSLDQAAKKALRAMIAWIGERVGLDAGEAYMLCSLAADLRVTQTVNGEKGVHCMLHRDRLAFAGG